MALFLTVGLGAGVAWGNSAPLLVVFAPSGRDLPQAAIRVAIGTELGREALSEAAVGAGSEVRAGAAGDVLSEQDIRERVMVAVDELGQLWVRYWGPRGLVDRHLAMPERLEQLPLVVSLSAGNLVRQEAFELLRDIERRRAEARAAAAEPAARAPAPVPPAAAPAAKPAPTTPPRRAPAQRASSSQRRNSWGNYWVGDFVYVPSVSRACSPSSSTLCYDDSGASVFYDVEGSGIAGGIQAAHSRYVMAYSRAFTPDLWGTVRAGVAISGGKAKDLAAEHGSGQSKFWPWLLELRLQYFPVPGGFNGALRPYAHGTLGSAEAAAELKLKAPAVFAGSDQPPEVPGQEVTATHALGLLYGGAGVGVSLAAFDGLRFETELSGFVALPSSGGFVRPSLGATYDF